jgi:hypothetical protein
MGNHFGMPQQLKGNILKITGFIWLDEIVEKLQKSMALLQTKFKRY